MSIALIEKRSSRLGIRRLVTVAVAVTAVVGFSLTSGTAAHADTGPHTVWSAGPTNYVYFNQVNNSSAGRSAVTFSGVYNGSTPSQWAVAKAQLRDEWGNLCWGPQNFSSSSGGVSSTSCSRFAGAASAGIVWGWNGSSYVEKQTNIWWYGGSGARGVATAPVLEGDPDWPVNEAGQTYGNSALAAPSDAPDLVTATATNGEQGYLLQTDIDSVTADALLNSGASFEAIQTWIDTVGSVDHTIPVYAEDGTTVLGEFLIPAAQQQ
jgi:hypothetical protein